MSTGRRRSSAACPTAPPGLIARAPRAGALNEMSTRPLSTATPKSAMKPTPAEIENGMSAQPERDDAADDGEGHVQEDQQPRGAPTWNASHNRKTMSAERQRHDDEQACRCASS